MRTATYLRFSSDNQKETSIRDQLRNVENYCDRQGWPKPEVFQDQAISGSRNDRPGYMALLEAAHNGKFDLLVVDDLSRLSRDQLETTKSIRVLKYLGVRVVGVSDGTDTDRDTYKIETGLRGMMNELYLDDLAKKTHRGLIGQALAGYSPGRYAYGYTSVMEGQNFKRQIDEEKAQWVRYIFRRYAEGVSPYQIVAELNEKGIKGPKGNKWSPATIQAKKGKTGQAGILGNPAYIGQHTWNKTKRVKNPLTNKAIPVARSKDEWITLTVPDLRIIDDETWNKCQARISKNLEEHERRKTENKTSGGRSAKYLFSGLLRCGVCGKPYVIANSLRYRCCASAVHYHENICNNKRTIRRDTLEQVLLEGIKKELLSEEKFQEFVRETQELLAQDRPDPAPIKKRIADAQNDLQNLMTAIKAGILTATTKAEVEATEQKIAIAQDELKTLENYEPAKILPNAREIYQSLVRTFQSVGNIHETREAIRQLVGSITLYPDQENPKGLIAEFQNPIFASMLSETHLLRAYQMRYESQPPKTIPLY